MCFTWNTSTTPASSEIRMFHVKHCQSHAPFERFAETDLQTSPFDTLDMCLSRMFAKLSQLRFNNRYNLFHVKHIVGR